MKIENDKWVEIHYTLKNDAGEQLDAEKAVAKSHSNRIDGCEQPDQKNGQNHHPGDPFFSVYVTHELSPFRKQFHQKACLKRPLKVFSPSAARKTRITQYTLQLIPVPSRTSHQQ